MSRVLHTTGKFIGIAVGSMIWFWLLYGNLRVVCGDSVRPFFMAGFGHFVSVALVWALIGAVLLSTQQDSPIRWWLCPVGFGSLFATFHLAAVHWLPGVNLAASALLAVLLAQSSTLLGLSWRGTASHARFNALQGWSQLNVGALVGLGATQLWLMSIRCQADLSYNTDIERIVSNPITWYLIWGTLPALVSAFLYASEKQPTQQ